MRRPFELKIAVVERHPVVLPAHPLANFPRWNDQFGPHRQGRDLHFARQVQVKHQAEGFGYGPSDCQQSMIAQDQATKFAEVMDDARALVEIERDAFIFVNPETAVELQSDLTDRHQAVPDRRHRHAGAGVRMDYAGGVMAGHMYGAMDG